MPASKRYFPKNQALNFKAPSVRELSAMLTEGVITCGQDKISEAERER